MSEGVTVVTGAVEGFDYGTLDSETRIVVQQRTGEIRSLVRRSAQDVVDIGVKLGEVKERLGHGGFGKWLATEFEWTQETARRFMQVASRFGQNPQIVEFAPSALYLLAASSTPQEAVDEAMERAASGERITHAAARGIVETYRPEELRGARGEGRVETDEERRQRIRENDRRMKDEINGRYAAAGPALPPVELMPIEDWELDEFVERVAGEAFGADRLGKEVVWNSMVIGAKGQSGEFWSRLRRALAPFDVTDEQVQEAVYEFVREADKNNGQRSTGNGQLSTGASAAPSAEARRFAQEVKAGTWGGVARDDRPMVTAEGLANSLRGWAAEKSGSALATAAQYRGGAVWFEARQIVSGLNYRDKELVAALGLLAEEGAREGEGERGRQVDPWVAAWAQRVPEAFEERVRRLAAEILPWTQAWTDDKGRTWRDLLDRNPQHANSPFRQDLDGECKRRGLLMAGGSLVAVIEEMFAALTAPSDNPLLSDGEDEESHEDAKALRGHEEEEQDGQAVPVSLRDGYDSDEWYTPRWVIEAARQVMGEIDLDPASCALAQDVVQAGLFWSKTQGGERMGWFGRVWLNPPYSAPALFVEKLMSEYRDGSVKQAVVLLNNATETGWFQALLARFPVCFLSKRLAFWRHDHADVGARQGQAVFYLGPDVEKFCEVFGAFGIVVRRVD